LALDKIRTLLPRFAKFGKQRGEENAYDAAEEANNSEGNRGSRVHRLLKI
jgi:hypothetical protein